MRIVQVIFLGLISLLVASCGSKGGAADGEIPSAKFLNGKVKGDFYYAPGNQFSIKLPHPPSASDDDRYEWMYTQIKEVKNKQYIGVIFGPAAIDHNDYHVFLSKKPMAADKESFAKSLFQEKLKERRGDFKQQLFEAGQVNGRNNFYAVYESKASMLALSVTDNGENYYILESDIYTGPMFKTVSLETLLRKEWVVFNRMLNSFTAPAAKEPEKTEQ